MAEAAREQQVPVRMQVDSLMQLPGVRQAGLLVGLAASIAAGVMLVLWINQPDYRLLFAGLTDQEAAEVIQALDSSGIPYRMGAGPGAVMVPPDKVYESRMKLAAQGLPQSSGRGFDSLQESQSIGTSQFMENARYHRALEEELARTIASLQPVQTARVHLALPKQSVFVRDRKTPSATVVVQLYPGRRLEKGQVAAITHTVASSIPELEAGRVTVVNQLGDLLTSPEQFRDVQMSERQFEYTRRLEEGYVRRIESLLIPILGTDKARAQVTAELDFTLVEETRESFNPDQSAIRSEQQSEERRTYPLNPEGVPGALSNQPPGPGVTETLDEVVGTDDNPTRTARIPVNSSVRSVRNYEVDKTISRIKQPTGRINRLSVAVVVDDWERVDDEGEPLRVPLTEEELSRITTLVKEAVGFSAERGDSLNVINQSFRTVDDLEPMPAAPIWQQPWARDLVRQAIVAIVLLVLGFGVLRPLLRSLLQPAAGALAAPAARVAPGGQLALGGSQPSAAAQAYLEGEGGVTAEMLAQEDETPDEAVAAIQRALSFEKKMEAVRSLATEDPKRVAQVVKGWLAKDE
ncbi:MAG: flagellar basal-body MS-ring/collar protein FliF [Pseudomonadota bacterium]|nr:flagellar basal-body MS-ring/collar protein FliF [Pseudomonadota bacterium]